MRPRMRDFFFIFILTLLTTVYSAAEASVTVIPLGPKDKKADDFPYVGSVVNLVNNAAGSGSVIGDGTFVLTARHVITHNGSERGMLLDASNFAFNLNGKTYFVDRVYGHSTDDLAILKLKENAGKAVPIYNKNPIGQTFYGVGFGKSSSCPSYDDIKWDVAYGTKRVYKNTFTWLQEEVSLNNGCFSVVDSFGFSLHRPETLFSPNGAIEGEGMHGPGDSGGPTLILDGDTYKIAGIMISMTVTPPYSGYIARVDTNLWWIKSVIEPDKGKTTVEILSGLSWSNKDSEFDLYFFPIAGLPVERKKFQIVPD